MVLVIGWIKAKKVNFCNTRRGAKTTLPALRAILWWGRRQSSSRWHLLSLKSSQCALLIKRQTEFFETDWEDSYLPTGGSEASVQEVLREIPAISQVDPEFCQTKGSAVNQIFGFVVFLVNANTCQSKFCFVRLQLKKYHEFETVRAKQAKSLEKKSFF